MLRPSQYPSHRLRVCRKDRTRGSIFTPGPLSLNSTTKGVENAFRADPGDKIMQSIQDRIPALFTDSEITAEAVRSAGSWADQEPIIVNANVAEAQIESATPACPAVSG